MYCMIHFQNPGYLYKFRHIQPYCGIFSHIVAYLVPYVTLTYEESCQIQNIGIFRIQDLNMAEFSICERYIAF